MGFFSHLGEGPEPSAQTRRVIARQRGEHGEDNEMPVPVGWRAMLARSDDLAVALVGAVVHSLGVRLSLAVRSQRPRPGMGALNRPVHVPDEGEAVDRLLLGVEFSDGRRATNLHTELPVEGDDDAADDQPMLLPVGGRSGPHWSDSVLFLYPLPPPGGLTIYCAWPGQGLAETRTELDTEVIAQAATRVEVLWPQPSDDAGEPPEPPTAPRVPPGGWFAATLQQNDRDD